MPFEPPSAAPAPPRAVQIMPLSGPPTTAALAALSELRLTVFREWPYLYAGDAAYEADYLATFAAARDAIIVCAYDGDRMVGAATGAPLASHTDAFVPLFERHGFDPATIFYCGESVLLPAYRGRGIGHAFFDQREARAQALNAAGADFRHSAFCGIVRSPGDPRQPADYRPLDGFWQKRGYRPVPGMTGSYDWREIGAAAETAHTMQFWIHPL